MTLMMDELKSEGPMYDILSRLAELEKKIRELLSRPSSSGGGDDFLVVQVFS